MIVIKGWCVCAHVLLACADACLVNILNARVNAYPNYVNLLNSCGEKKHRHRRKLGKKLVCLVEPLTSTKAQDKPLLKMTQWNLCLILSSGKKILFPMFPCTHTIDFKVVRLSLDALIPCMVSCYPLSGSYWDVGMNGYRMNGALGCAVGRACCESWGFLRQGSQPEVLHVSNEQCSAPWDNNESRAVLKINKPLELSVVSFIEK